jgi:alpha-2-macroglobulin-like protein
MKKHERESWRERLLEHLFGCSEDPAEVERALEKDPELRELLEEVRGTADLLKGAVREEVPGLVLEPPVARTRRRFWTPLRIAAAIVVALGLGVTSGWWGISELGVRSVRSETLRLVVTGTESIPDGAPVGLRVETWDYDGAAQPALVKWAAYDSEGTLLESAEEESNGAIDLAFAPRLTGLRRVEVNASRADIQRTAVFELSPEKANPLAHLSIDKPAYRPGETVWLRALLLRRLSLQPFQGFCNLRIVDPKGAPVHQVTPPLEEGVAALSWMIPESAAGGMYALELRDGGDEFTAERLEFLVRRYQPPRLAKKVTLDRETYAPGEEGSVEIEVLRVEGGIPAGAMVRGALVIDGEEVWKETAVLDGDGVAIFRFRIPEMVERGDARFAARVTDGGVVETKVEPFVIPVGGVEVAFFPEGGDLVAGLQNRVYAEVTDVLGRPASAQGRVVDSNGREIVSFRTEHQGRARFELTPRSGERYTLELEESEQIELPLPKTTGAVLRSVADSSLAGEPVELEVATAGDGPWILGLYCRGVLVAQDVFRGTGRRTLALQPAEEIAGVLRATLFDREMNPVAERLLHRASGRAIELEVIPELRETVPGAHQRVELRARDENGAPVACVLGVSVTDRAVRDMVGEARVGLADQTWLAADVDELEEVEEFFANDAESRRNVDLLLGTRGWRRFAWREPKVLIEERGEEAQRLLAREGCSQVPSVLDDDGDAASLVAAARRKARAAQELLTSAVTAIAVAFALWFLFQLFWWGLGSSLERRPVWRRNGAGALTASTAALLFVAGATFFNRPVDFLRSAQGVAFEVAALAVDDEAGFDRANLVLEANEVPPGADDEVFFLGHAQEWRRKAGGRGGGEAAGPGAPPPVLPPGARRLMADYWRAGPEKELQLDDLEEADDADFFSDNPFPLPRGRRGGYTRVYAHVNRGTPDGLRSDFAETVYWNGLLRTSREGSVRFEFDLSDRVTTWNVNIDAHGGGRVGQGQASFEAVTPFHLDARLPVELTAGDHLLLPVAVTSSNSEATSARLFTELQGPLAFGIDFLAEQRIALKDGRGRLLVPLVVNRFGGEGRIALGGQADGWHDGVVRDLRIVPRGFPKHVTKGGMVTESVEFELAIPEDFAPGSLSAELVLYPSRLSDILEGLEGILRQPNGCFEQASSSNYPNVLALSYLEAAGADEPAIAARARALMGPGYAKIAGYECTKRGYEWFGGDPGHEALSAYGLLQFHDMAQVFDVDAEMVGRTRSWLLGRRNGEGGYLRNDRALDSFGAAPQPVTDAYVTYALVTTGEDPLELQVELATLKKRAVESDDPYEVALAAGALFAAEDWAAADAARDRLKKMQREDGSLVGTTSSITHSGGADLAVETTSLAILAWLDDEEDAPYVQRAVEFLATSRRPGGTFGATQATIQALRALTRYAAHNRRVANPGEARLYINDYEVEWLAIREGQRGAISFERLAEQLNPGVNRVRLELTGGNEFPWAIDLSYFAEQPADDPEATVTIETRLAQVIVEEGATVALEAEVTNLTDEGRPMTLAIIGLPAGLEAPTEVLEDLENAERFDLWEIRGRELILYWRDLAPGEKKSVTIDLIARIPGTTTGPASRVYLYYTPDAKRWAEPLEVEVKPAR